jgi:hypothetical protein
MVINPKVQRRIVSTKIKTLPLKVKSHVKIFIPVGTPITMVAPVK